MVSAIRSAADARDGGDAGLLMSNVRGQTDRFPPLQHHGLTVQFQEIDNAELVGAYLRMEERTLSEVISSLLQPCRGHINLAAIQDNAMQGNPPDIGAHNFSNYSTKKT